MESRIDGVWCTTSSAGAACRSSRCTAPAWTTARSRRRWRPSSPATATDASTPTCPGMGRSTDRGPESQRRCGPAARRLHRRTSARDRCSSSGTPTAPTWRAGWRPDDRTWCAVSRCSARWARDPAECAAARSWSSRTPTRTTNSNRPSATASTSTSSSARAATARRYRDHVVPGNDARRRSRPRAHLRRVDDRPRVGALRRADLDRRRATRLDGRVLRSDGAVRALPARHPRRHRGRRARAHARATRAAQPLLACRVDRPCQRDLPEAGAGTGQDVSDQATPTGCEVQRMSNPEPHARMPKTREPTTHHRPTE